MIQVAVGRAPLQGGAAQRPRGDAQKVLPALRSVAATRPASNFWGLTLLLRRSQHVTADRRAGVRRPAPVLGQFAAGFQRERGVDLLSQPEDRLALRIDQEAAQ